jgi:hypothetical protein
MKLARISCSLILLGIAFVLSCSLLGDRVDKPEKQVKRRDRSHRNSYFPSSGNCSRESC